LFTWLSHRHRLELTVTTSFTPSRRSSSGRGPVATAAIGLVAAAAAITLFVAGVTFLGLAIALPIAVPVAAAYHVPVSAADVALAERFAAFWWVFAALCVASFVAAGVVVVKAITFLSPGPRD
jgi:hypothetical protein